MSVVEEVTVPAKVDDPFSEETLVLVELAE